jgi:hypothetical protein
MLTDHELDIKTANWKVLNKNLRELTEEELKRALSRNLAITFNKDIAVRLHQRYCALRDARERAEVISAFDEPMPDFLGGAA